MVIISNKQIKEFKATKYISGEEVAYAMLIMHIRPNGKKVGLIEDVWTHENHRKKGIANELIRELLVMADQEGIYKVVLSCSDTNLSLYEKLGFSKHENSMRLNLE